MWERYCRGVDAIVFVLDASDQAKLSSAKTELYSLIEKPVLKGIPLLVLANKNDLQEAISVDEVIETLSLRSITDREVACYSISAKNSNNIDKVLEWLMKHAGSK
jgi:ADP-ribosylation factor-like protein 8